jgi:acylphosphatase
MPTVTTDLVCIHCYVTGQVQGVFYRATTESQASRLGLAGWVRNLPDGRVELVAQGPRARVTELRAWLAQGPASARVERVECQEQPPGPESGFSVRY